MAMISAELRELLRPSTLTSRVVWFALTASIWVYVGIVYYLQALDKEPTRTLDPMFAATFYVLSGAVAAASLVYRRWARSDSRFERILRENVDPNALAMNPKTRQPNISLLRRLEALQDFEQRIFRLNMLYQTSMIVSLALNEVIALFGFVLGFVGRDMGTSIPFAVIATALNLVVFPRPESVTARVQRWVQLTQD